MKIKSSNSICNITIVFSRKSIGCLKDLLNRYTFEDINEQGVITSPITGYNSLCELPNMAIYIDDNIQISEKEVLAGLLLEIATSM